MFVEERRNKIVFMVNKYGRVKVKDLSSRFKVTEDCIRKDLSVLEQEGLLKKTYGGAVKNRINSHDIDVIQRKDKNLEAKKAIAKKAVSLISDGDMVFLDISTSNIELAHELLTANLNITVVTNMVDVFLTLRLSDKIKLIFIGGIPDKGGEGFIGSLTNEMLDRFRFDIAFVGVVGVDVYGNSIETYSPCDGITKEKVLKNSRKKYLMMETEKFSKQGTYKYAQLEEITGIIMEKGAPSDIAEAIEEFSYGVSLLS